MTLKKLKLQGFVTKYNLKKKNKLCFILANYNLKRKRGKKAPPRLNLDYAYKPHLGFTLQNGKLLGIYPTQFNRGGSMCSLWW